MKKVTILGLILLGLGFSPLLVKADLIPTGMHSVDRCVRITNSLDLPDVYVIENSSSGIPISIVKSQNVIVKNDQCLFADSLYYHSIFFVVDKSYIDSIGVDNFVPPQGNIFEKGVVSLKKDFNSYGHYVSDKDPVKKQSIDYLLVKDSGGNFFLQKDKIISEYSNGTPNKIETFPVSSNNKKSEIKKDTPTPVVVNNKGNGDVPNNNEVPVQPVKKSFWHRLACFFGIIRTC